MSVKSRTKESASSGFNRGGAAVLVAAVFVLTACSQGSGVSSGESQSGGAAPQPNSTSLPGTKEFGLTDVEFADHVEKAQSLIASCMSAAGFEYVPVDVATVEAGQARVRHDPDVTRLEFKQKWGLAVTTRFDNPVRDTGLGPQNLAIFAHLSPVDQVAYDRTLFGKNTKADFVFSLDEEDFSSTGGCTRAAVAKVFTPAQVSGTFVNPKDVLVNSDRRIVAARQAWSQCMRAAGYDYVGDQDEIISDFEDRLDKLLNGADPTTLTGPRLVTLHAMQAEEIRTALADLDCQIKHTDSVYDQVETEVYGHKLN